MFKLMLYLFQINPVLVQELITHEVASVAAGAAHCVAVTAQGQTFVWGRGDGGQVGRLFFNPSACKGQSTRYN